MKPLYIINFDKHEEQIHEIHLENGVMHKEGDGHQKMDQELNFSQGIHFKTQNIGTRLSGIIHGALDGGS